MKEFFRKFALYIKFCVFLGIMTIGIINMTPREVNANNSFDIVGET